MQTSVGDQQLQITICVCTQQESSYGTEAQRYDCVIFSYCMTYPYVFSMEPISIYME